MNAGRLSSWAAPPSTPRRSRRWPRPRPRSPRRALAGRPRQHGRRHDPDRVDRPQRGLRHGRHRALQAARGVASQGDPGVRTAFANLAAAKANLPPDTTGLVVILDRHRPGRAQPGRDRDRGGPGQPVDRRRADCRSEPAACALSRRYTARSAAIPDPGSGFPTRRFADACSFASSPTSRGTRAADVLVVPIVGEPAFEGSSDELDRRTGGELRALARVRRAVGQALRRGPRGARRAARRAAPGGRRPATPRRSTARRPVTARAPRSSAGSVGRAVASPGDLAGAHRGGAWTAARRARRRARRPRRRRGRLRAQDDLPRGLATRRPPALDELVLVAARRRRGRRCAPAPSAAGSSARAPTSPAASPTAPPTTSRPLVLADEARAIAEAHGLCDRRHRRAARRRAGHGHVPRRRPGQRQPAADDRHALRRRGRAGRLGRHLARSSARASASTPAASASSRPTGWKR